MWDDLVDTATNTMSVSLPLDVIGKPTRQWQYFVGVGLTTDRTMNFLYGGPAPVYPQHPVYISGGEDAAGRNPAFLDILLPDDVDQSALLGKHDGWGGPVVRMMGSR